MRITALSVLRVETSGSGQAKAKPDMRRRQRTPPPILLGANAGLPWSRSRQFRQPFGLPEMDNDDVLGIKSASRSSQLPLQDPDRRRPTNQVTWWSGFFHRPLLAALSLTFLEL